MDEKIYTYDGDSVTVTWNQKRCIHAKECVRGLPDVFDPDRRPWVDPDQADADAVTDVVRRCPTGALHLTRKGENPEPTPNANHIQIEADGPLYIRGDIELLDSNGDVFLRDTRVALCRCGRSSNKPLCDGSHTDGFADDGSIRADNLSATAGGDTLRLQTTPGGPVLLSGSVTIEGTDGSAASGSKGALCRCGASSRKPFCDGSHADIGFDAA